MAEYTALLVDDESDFVSTLAERLRLRNVDAVVAYDGYEALEKLEELNPLVVVLDVMMPGFSGLEVLAEIKRKRPEVQVILLTGRGMTQEGIEGMRRGAFDYLNKPVQLDELLEKMNQAALQAPGVADE